ncbi:MAG TPA: VCBS repeat-containing protein [Kofleriaceae bacterium]|nr:VCBS repeat-containing protein [Kofleriaceae bacterium]
MTHSTRPRDRWHSLGVSGLVMLVAAALAACTDLGDVERGRCGNGVVEPGRGEDCDRGDATCGAPGTAAECRLLCGPSVGGGAECPRGGACGVDGVCHAPSDQLEVTMSGAWTARYLLAGDTTGDQYPELVGVGDNQLDVRLGGPDGTFAQSVTMPNLPLYDVPRAADVNGDTLTDIIVPVGIGFYSLVGDPLTALQPIFQDSFSFPTSGAMVMTSVTFMLGSGNNQVPATESLAAMHMDQSEDCPLPGGCDIVLLKDAGVGMPPGRRTEHIVQDEIAWAHVLSQPQSHIVAAVAFGDDPSTPIIDESGVFTYEGDAVANTFVATGQITLPGKVTGGAWLSDLDRDARADLLVSIDGPFGAAVMVAWAKAGGWDAPVYLVGGPGPTQGPGRPLAFADVDDDAAADLITEDGIWFTSCILRTCSFVLGSSQDHDWRGAVVADINGDENPDVAGFTRGGAIVDVLLGTGARGFWNQAPLAAPGDVTMMRSGDFDGNGVADLALVTSPFDVSGADEIHVVYGRASEPPSAPTYMGFVGTVVAMDVAQAPLPGRQDTIDDLFVVSERASGRGIAIVIGSTSRRMIAPLIPTAFNNDFNIVESILTMPLDGDAIDDVVVLLTSIDTSSAGSEVAVRSSLRVYTSDAAGTLTERTMQGGVPVDSEMFALSRALWTAIPPRSGVPATIVGIDLVGRAVAVPITCAGAMCSLTQPTGLLTGAEMGEPTSLHTADLDDDGDLDVIATFRAVDDQPGGALIWHRDGGSFGSAQILDAPADTTYVDAAAADLDLDGKSELLLLARGDGEGAGVLMSTRDDGGTYGAPARDARFDAERTGQGITIHAGDVTGDGLPDVTIVAGTDRTAPRAIAVFTQRESRGRLADAAAPDAP